MLGGLEGFQMGYLEEFVWVYGRLGAIRMLSRGAPSIC